MIPAWLQVCLEVKNIIFSGCIVLPLAWRDAGIGSTGDPEALIADQF